MKKLFLSTLFLFSFAVFAMAQTIPIGDITSDNIFEKLFSPLLMGIVILTGILAKYIPQLVKVNKATLTLVTSVIIGGISIAFFKGNALQVIISVLMAIGAYNGVISQAVNKPLIMKKETIETSEIEN